ncbi:MAG: DUF4377 domain-containing protein [Bacteroides sp.]|nr:DUF4377 domain-containing protein [Bacteroides sp.]
MKYILLLLSFLFVFAGCSKDDNQKDKIITLTIASEKRMGYISWSSYVGPCYLVKDVGSDQWLFFRQYIKGFDPYYEEGYEYVVELNWHIDSFDSSLADQELDSYSLRKIISKEKKDSENLPADIVPHLPD